jgi:hypothetical protein
LGGMILGHQHIAEPAATITMSTVFLCIMAIRPNNTRPSSLGYA